MQDLLNILFKEYHTKINPKDIPNYDQYSPHKLWTHFQETLHVDGKYTLGSLFVRIIGKTQELIHRNVFNIEIYFEPSIEGGYSICLVGHVQETDEIRKIRLSSAKKYMEERLKSYNDMSNEIDGLKNKINEIATIINELDS